MIEADAQALVALESAIEADREIPSTLFDSFVENALDNARAKLAREPDARVAVRLRCTADDVCVEVRDSGSAVPAAVARRLFREPIERDEGLGIGLYHAARQAQQAGYRVELAANEAGEVRFILALGG